MSHVIPDRILEEIKSRTSIVDVISSRVTLKRSGSVYKACCPFHKEKTPSFSVNPARESYKCFGCGEGGDVFSFLMKHDGMTFVDAVKMLGDRCGVEVEFGDDGGNAAAAKRLFALHTEVAEFYRRCLTKMKKSEVARAYLKSRDLSDEIAEKFKIGYALDAPGTLEQFAEKKKFTLEEIVAAGLATPLDRPRPGVNLHDRFAGRLMFPICDTQGRVIAFSGRIMDPAKHPAKYVNSPETEIFKKSHVLYALDKAQRSIVSAPHREAIICEGQIDVIRCHACGFDRAVASQGTAFTEDHAKLLKRYADSAVLMFDQDSAGQKAAVRTGAVLLAAGIPVRVARLTEGEDPDSFLRKNPPEVFQKVLDDAIGLVPFHVAYLQKLEADPKSEGAVGRIAAGVLQTIAVCHNEVHKARMVQELAELLNIPEAAFENELTGVEEALKRQRETLERRESTRAEYAGSSGRSASGFSGSRPSSSSSGDFIPFDEPMVYLEPEDSFGEVSGSGAGTTAQGKLASLPDRTDIAVCELLVHGSEESPEVLELLIDNLPEWLLPEGLCRKVVSAFYESHRTKTDKVLELQSGDKAAEEFIGSLAVMPNRVSVRENCLPLDLARELVLAEWRRWCMKRKTELEPKEGAEDTMESGRKRANFTVSLMKLKSWATGESVIRILMGTDEGEKAIAMSEKSKANSPALDGNSDTGMNEQAQKAERGYADFGADEEDRPPQDDLVPEFEGENDDY